MNEMDANDFDNEGLLRFTRNDRRKRGVVTMAIVRGSLKKGDCFRQGIRNDTSASLQSLCRHYKRYFVIARNGVVVRLFRSKLKGIAEIASLLSVARNDNVAVCHCEGGTTEAIYLVQARNMSMEIRHFIK